MTALLRLAHAIDQVSASIARIVRWALLANALLIAGNAIARKLFSVTMLVAFDLQWHFFAAVVLLMAAHTLQRDEHVRVDLLAHRFGERGLARLDLIGFTLILLPLCLLDGVGHDATVHHIASFGRNKVQSREYEQPAGVDYQEFSSCRLPVAGAAKHR